MSRVFTLFFEHVDYLYSAGFCQGSRALSVHDHFAHGFFFFFFSSSGGWGKIKL